MNDDKHLLILSKLSLPAIKKKAKSKFQEWSRYRDKDDPCISCGKTTAGQWDGGHYYKAELYSTLIFNEVNCNKQCSYCNDYLAGNLTGYREGLINKYGQAEVESLDHLARMDKLVTFKPKSHYYAEKFLYYKNKLKEK